LGKEVIFEAGGVGLMVGEREGREIRVQMLHEMFEVYSTIPEFMDSGGLSATGNYG
jgi:hypothetical protein